MRDVFARQFAGVVAWVLVAGSIAGANPVVSNGGFEEDIYLSGPGGTAGQNGGAITDWTIVGSDGHVGINPFWTDNTQTTEAGSPHADNGAVPEGKQVGFLRFTGHLSQTVSGFTAGDRYVVNYRENNRTGSTGQFRVDVESTTVVADHATTAVAGSNPYRVVRSDVFTAAAADQTLHLISTSGQDSSVLVDDVQVATVIHHDTFGLTGVNRTDNAPLHATSPEYSIVGGAAWTASGINYADDGNGGGFVDRNATTANATLPLNLAASDEVLTLSAKIYPGDGNQWTGIGFTEGNNANHLNSATGGVLWVFLTSGGGTGDTVDCRLHVNDQGGASLVGSIATTVSDLEFTDVKLVWDRRTNTAHVTVNGELLFAEIDLDAHDLATGGDGVFDPIVGGVGMTMTSGTIDGSSTAARVDDFLLTSVINPAAAIPEPGALAVLMPGLWMLGRRRE